MSQKSVHPGGVMYGELIEVMEQAGMICFAEIQPDLDLVWSHQLEDCRMRNFFILSYLFHRRACILVE